MESDQTVKLVNELGADLPKHIQSMVPAAKLAAV
jgi:hypothetical protein